MTAESLPPALAGERVDRVVSMITGASRSSAAELVAEGRVRVNGTVVTSRSLRLEEGDLVEVHELPGAGEVEGVVPDASVAVDVRYADDDVIVIDKPAGLVVHPGAGNQTGTLVSGLLARFPDLAGVGADPARPGIVHRLDKDTSGLMVVARSAPAYEALVAALAARAVTRRYTALVWGTFDAPSGVVDAPIGRSGRDPTRMAVTSRGREARTRYDLVETFHQPVDVSLLRCTLETGRTHQIRVHLSAIGHPVVGDARYGGARQSLPVPRQFLHAGELAFDHPVTGERLSFESALPADLAEALARLR